MVRRPFCSSWRLNHEWRHRAQSVCGSGVEGIGGAGESDRRDPSSQPRKYLAGAYLGCDIQTLPAAIGLRSGTESGYGYAKLPARVMEINGEPVRQWRLESGGKALWRIAERIAGTFDETVERAETLRGARGARTADWAEITKRWMKK